MGRVVPLSRLPAEQIAFGFPEDFAALSREKVGAPAADMDTGELTSTIYEALRRAFDGADSPVKRIARIANSNTRAAENWWQGKNLPDVVHFLRLAAQIPELKAEVRRLLGLREDLDPEFERSVHDLLRQFWKAKGQVE